ncbi:MAG TPA: transcriptional repressor [Candidatus Blautia intestinipullorum]|nr:transcriptional repressor [Candidatus Blautia intestinipullorum]
MAALKYSRQRESIKEFLMTRTDHPTADTVYENMKIIYPNISLGTVYRNLSLLSDIGEIQKLESFGGADRFDGRTDPHCHFICTGCGCVQDLEMEDLQDIIHRAEKDFKGKITECTARFSGLCENCLKKEKC